MIVWGGNPYRNSGGIYDPVSDTWQPTSLANAPLGRVVHTAVWTGTEMIIWGGMVQTGATVGPTNTGGRYNPVTDTWIAMSTLGAPEPRESHTAVWTGSKMIVWGGWGNTYLNSGGVYDPATDTWQTVSITDVPPARTGHTAVWSGNEMIVWGGSGSGGILNNGARYDPIASTWAVASNVNQPSLRDSHSAVWTGTQMIIWGGHVQTGINTGTDTGGRYSP
jgi:N-acetylneuraminic acid mutarotase